MTPEFQRFLALGIPRWSTWDDGPTARSALPYRVGAADSREPVEQVRFGAFIGWVENFRWWLEVAAQLPDGALAQCGLLDIEHQAGGHRCVPWAGVALPVRIHADYLAFASMLCRDDYDGQGGYLSGSGDPHDAKWLARYRKRAQEAGLAVDADVARAHFREAAYPLNGSDHNIDLFLAQPGMVRTRLESIPAPRPPIIFILADNSD